MLIVLRNISKVYKAGDVHVPALIDLTMNIAQGEFVRTSANVDIVTKQLEDVLTIPLEALRVENGDDVVEVLIDEAPKTRKVRVAFRTDTQAVITQGIQEHDQLIIPSFKADEPHK